MPSYENHQYDEQQIDEKLAYGTIFLLTGLRIYTGESKAQGPREGIMRAAGFGFARIDTQAS